MIYFAQMPSGAIKIGSSNNVPERLRTLSFEYRAKLPLLAVLPGGRKEEHQMHRRFAHLRFEGTEQFRPDPELLEFIGRPLFATCGDVEKTPRACPEPYDLGLTAKEINRIMKSPRVRNFSWLFRNRHEFIRWLIRLGYREYVASKKIPENPGQPLDPRISRGYTLNSDANDSHPEPEP